MIGKLLIANRGEIVSRVIRTARSMGIATVAVFSDADAGAPFVADADQAVHLPGAAPAATYLNVERLIEAARRTGADAVHPGYGFLSEQAAFARACAGASLVFVGPPAAAIEAMGSKVTAKRLMADAGVPVLPGAVVSAATAPDELRATAERTGLPLLVKAAFGGGGRGMRVVTAADDLATAVASASREAEAAFGDGLVFVERLVTRARHVEVQVFGDAHGNVVHLFERECSIQRRHQKIVEEAPSPAVDARLRSEMGQAAVAAAKAIGYEGAGTVEFLLEPHGQFWFLEMNTRLQVEHPVTEMITGLDLVELQLRIASGEALPADALEVAMSGHAVEARVYAEDVAAGFLPVAGVVHRFRVSPREGLRVDAGVTDGFAVSAHYDAMLAKVVAWARTRLGATRILADALAAAEIHGIATNRDLLVGVLRHPEFVAGATDTAFLERHDPVELGAAHRDPEAVSLHAIAAALAAREARRSSSPLPAGIPPAWRNVGPADQPHAFVVDGEPVEVRFGDGVPGRRPHLGAESIRVAGKTVDVRVFSASPELVDLGAGGRRVRCRVHRVGDVTFVDSSLGSTTLVDVARFPAPGVEAGAGSLLSPMPGAVVHVEAVVGAHVRAGDLLVTLEAMKMEHAIRAPHDGVVAEVRVTVGDQVDTGTVLAVVDAAPDSA